MKVPIPIFVALAAVSTMLGAVNETPTQGRLPMEWLTPVPLSPEGRAEDWLVAGSWGGPAGLSLMGIDTENEARPCMGDMVLRRSFDSFSWTNWTAAAYTPGTGYVIEENGGNSVWAKATAYAFSWVVAGKAGTARLAVTHGGIGTTLFANGKQLSPVLSHNHNHGTGKGEGTTDQGNSFEVDYKIGGREDVFDVPLRAGANRMLLKFVRQDKGGTPVAFDAVWSGAEMKTTTADPDTDLAKHAALGRMWAKVDVSAPANLPYPGDSLEVTTAINFPWMPTPKVKSGATPPVSEALPAVCPFAATIEQVVRDWGGAEIARVSYPITVPGTNTTALCTAGETGYYSIHTTVRNTDGRILFVFPTDGFSVVPPHGGADSKLAESHGKIATCFYWLNTKNSPAIFTWMDRMGIRHNVGGNIADEAIFSEAARWGITLTADFLDQMSSVKEEAKRSATASAAPFAHFFKAWNEIDICPKFRGDGEKWTSRMRLEHKLVHEARPDALYTGGSLVRPAVDDWFDSCLKHGLYDCIDVWDVHAYPQRQPSFSMRHISNNENESGPGVEKCIRRTLGRENDKPFIMGETGARCCHGADARRWQADMVAKMAAWGVASTNYLRIAFLVPWRKGSMGDDIPIAHHPAEAALATVTRLIDGQKAEPVAGLPDDIESRRFGHTTMLWSRSKPIEVTLEAPEEGEWVLVDVVGRVHHVNRDANGILHVTVTSSPIYLLTAAEYMRHTGIFAH